MSLKDEFLKSLVGQQKDGKIRFALDDHGDITHLIKRVDPRCREVYEKLARERIEKEWQESVSPRRPADERG